MPRSTGRNQRPRIANRELTINQDRPDRAGRIHRSHCLVSVPHRDDLVDLLRQTLETIQIQGQYRGVPGPTRLRVQIQQPGGWAQYPLPAVTQPSGEFRAFVELGEPGEYRLRIVDPNRAYASEVLTLLVF